MERIYIREIEYIYSTHYMDIGTEEDRVEFLKVTFDFGYIRDCKLAISIKEIKEISDYQIKKHILRCMDVLMERKFIDEI